MDSFLFAQNKTHLLSTATYDCLYCEKPQTLGYTREQLFNACLDPGVVPEYYLSIVVAARPMDYTADYRTKLQNTIDSTFLMAEKTKTLMEIILVDWNPQPQRRPLRDSFRFRRSDFLTYRILTVPRQIHDSLYQPDRSPTYEFEAKNVGIRFARGEFVLCSKLDDIWTTHLHNAVKSRSWRKGIFYTQSQKDDSNGIKEDSVQLSSFPTDDELDQACGIHDDYPMGSFKMTKAVEMNKDNYVQMTRHAGDFSLADRDTWKLTQGYREIGAKTWMDVELLLTAAWTLDIPIAYQPTSIFNCHQTSRLYNNNDMMDNVDIDDIKSKKISYMNKPGHWGLQGIDLYEQGMKCEVFRGGLGI
ncbi:uncharacterized protein BX664DRAFT_258050 [Halteromyces radiatus]|uniref:uncharacterized protein n=1 Tax=Halteromyces radiatus TaxID=101107 RepID=UPI0022205292|nr:uncharacterized protein BX664DRAFT_258050 [Halteromyces radiatus]KAI8096490.1 hypothetical protein BX664DRAFT_258050 [Halteromyces radiatus]